MNYEIPDHIPRPVAYWYETFMANLDAQAERLARREAVRKGEREVIKRLWEELKNAYEAQRQHGERP